MGIQKLQQRVQNKPIQVYPTLAELNRNRNIMKPIFTFHILWFVLGMFGLKYIDELFMFDLMIMLITVLHTQYVIPNMIKGKWNLHYRKSYESFTFAFFIRDIIVIGAFIRWFGFVLLSKGLQLLTGGELDELANHLMSRVSLNVGILAAAVLYGGYIFFMYGKEKSIHIGTYNRKVYQRVMSERIPLGQAAMQIQKEILQRLSAKEMEMQKQKEMNQPRTPYDYSGLPKELQPKKAVTPKVTPEPVVYTVNNGNGMSSVAYNSEPVVAGTSSISTPVETSTSSSTPRRKKRSF